MWTLSFTTRNDTHAPITHPFLTRIFCLPRWLLTLSRGWLKCSMRTVTVLRVYFLGDSWPYLLVRLVLPHPVTSLAAQVWMLFNLGAWMPRGAFRVVTCHRNLSDRIAKFSLFSLRAVLQLDLQRVVSLSPQRIASVFTLYSPIYYNNKPVTFTPQSVVGVLNTNS